MHDQHIIEQAKFDITFASEVEASEQLANLGSVVKDGLMSVVDEVFNEFSDQEYRVSIDHLELDLGFVHYSSYQHEMREKLREKLRQALREKLQSQDGVSISRNHTSPRQRTEYERMEWFLLHGHVPSHLNRGKDRTIEDMLDEVLHSDKDRFVEFLKRSTRRETVVKRLVNQFPATILEHIVHLLEPSHSKVVAGFVDELTTIVRRAGLIEGSEKELAQFIWEELIHKLLEAGQTDLSKAALVSQLVKKISLRQGMNESQILIALTNIATQVETREGRALELTHILQRLRNVQAHETRQRDVVEASLLKTKSPLEGDDEIETGTETRIKSESWPASKKERFAVEIIRTRLISAMMQGTAQGLDDIWQTCLRDHPELVKDLFKDYGRQAKTRRALASGFPYHMLWDIVGLFGPVEKRFIQEILERLEQFWETCGHQAGDIISLKRRIWNYTLTYLLLERESSFNRMMYLRSLIRQTVTYDQKKDRQLLYPLTDVLRQVEGQSILKQEMLQLLSDHSDEVSSPQSDVTDYPYQSESLIRSYDLYERLRARLLPSEWSPEGGLKEELTEIIDELARDYPWQLLRLYRELQSGTRSRIQGPTRLSRHELYRLIQALLSLVHPPDEHGESSDLLRAIEAYANQTKDKKRYYEQILACLIMNTVIDFGAIIAETQAAVITESKDGRTTGMPSSISEQTDEGRAQTRDTFAQRLLANRTAWARSSAHELYALITTFLALPSSEEHEGSVDLLQAIDTYARQATDRRWYYEQVLMCLVQNITLDFEHILAENQAADDKPEHDKLASDFHSIVKTSEQPAGSLKEEPQLHVADQQEDEFLRHLGSHEQLSTDEITRLVRFIEHMIIQQPERFKQVLGTSLEEQPMATRIIDLLPERLLTRLLFLLRPTEYQRAQRCIDMLADACYAKDLAWMHDRIHRLKWVFLFQYLFEEGWVFDEKHFVWGFVHYISKQSGNLDGAEILAILSQQLALNILPSTRDQHRRIIDALSRMTEEESRPLPKPQMLASSKLPSRLKDEERDWIEDIYIRNAGQVLAAPYLPRLFSMLNLTEESAFTDRNAAERAVHLLQYMVDERCDSPEYQLVLNKILCGVKTGVPIARGINIMSHEKETIEVLIQGMIQNWKIIGNTSVAGLRESFLQREGRLQLKGDAWHLSVEPKAFDMLLDHIPWSFSTIKHPWMERVIYVHWR